MEILSYFLIGVYLISLLSLLAYGINCYVLMFLHRFHRNKAFLDEAKQRELFLAKVAAEGYPKITIQLPVFNERYVVERLLKGARDIRYPKELFEIQILDDSTDDTVEIVENAVSKYRSQGFDVVHLRRLDRTGYKAGALEAAWPGQKGRLSPFSMRISSRHLIFWIKRFPFL